MKKYFSFILVLFFIPSLAYSQNSFQGYYVGTCSSYVVYYTLSDDEDKSIDVWLWNSLTNQTDSLRALEVKCVGDELFYCESNTIKSRNLSKADNTNDSVIIKTPFDIESFSIDDNRILVAEIDSSYEKVNILYYIDGACSFCQSVPCRPEEMEWKISTIYSYEDYYIISVQYDLYLLDTKKLILNKLVENGNDYSMDQYGNIYYTQTSENSAKALYAININDTNCKSEICKVSNDFDIFRYNAYGSNRNYIVSDGNLYELENKILRPISDIRILNKKLGDIVITPQNADFIIK